MNLTTEPLPGGLRVRSDTSWAAFARGLYADPAVRHALTASIRDCRFEAVFWETSPVSAGARDRPVAWVLLDAPALARVRPDPLPFAPRLSGPGPTVRTFPNLGGDATLVVPCDAGTGGHAHLASFVRTAPAAQVDSLWSAVGRAVEGWWARTDDPVWTSTSGLGVSWVHVRLDRAPKYYQHAPYRTWRTPGRAGSDD